MDQDRPHELHFQQDGRTCVRSCVLVRNESSKDIRTRAEGLGQLSSCDVGMRTSFCRQARCYYMYRYSLASSSMLRCTDDDDDDDDDDERETVPVRTVSNTIAH